MVVVVVGGDGGWGGCDGLQVIIFTALTCPSRLVLHTRVYAALIFSSRVVLNTDTDVYTVLVFPY